MSTFSNTNALVPFNRSTEEDPTFELIAQAQYFIGELNHFENTVARQVNLVGHAANNANQNALLAGFAAKNANQNALLALEMVRKMQPALEQLVQRTASDDVSASASASQSQSNSGPGALALGFIRCDYHHCPFSGPNGACPGCLASNVQRKALAKNSSRMKISDVKTESRAATLYGDMVNLPELLKLAFATDPAFVTNVIANFAIDNYDVKQTVANATAKVAIGSPKGGVKLPNLAPVTNQQDNGGRPQTPRGGRPQTPHGVRHNPATATKPQGNDGQQPSGNNSAQVNKPQSNGGQQPSGNSRSNTPSRSACKNSAQETYSQSKGGQSPFRSQSRGRPTNSAQTNSQSNGGQQTDRSQSRHGGRPTNSAQTNSQSNGGQQTDRSQSRHGGRPTNSAQTNSQSNGGQQTRRAGLSKTE